MKKLLQIFTITILLSTSCGKAGNPSPDTLPPAEVKKFKIESITTASADVIIGQRVNFQAELTDSTGNVNYEWRLFFNGKQIANTVSGRGLSSVRIRTDNVGDYTLTLTITRGASDKATLEKKLTSKAGDFQYGIWGDTEQTIKTAESDNGYSIYDKLVGIPNVTDNNAGLTTLTYERDSKLYSYYFKSGKLYAGAYTVTWDYQNVNTEMRPAYGLFDQEKTNTEKLLGIAFGNENIWFNDFYKKIYDTDIVSRAKAVGLGYLRRKVDGSSTLGKSTIELYKFTATSILFSYILVAPN